MDAFVTKKQRKDTCGAARKASTLDEADVHVIDDELTDAERRALDAAIRASQEEAAPAPARPKAPLAERMRPKVRDRCACPVSRVQVVGDVVGQDGVLGAESILRRLIERDALPNCILWGPVRRCCVPRDITDCSPAAARPPPHW